MSESARKGSAGGMRRKCCISWCRACQAARLHASEVLHKLVQSLPVGEVACGTDELQSLRGGEDAGGP
jgi:hypothetical protein